MCGFRKTNITQHALFKSLTSWQNLLDREGFISSFLMNLSKAYDCLPHDLFWLNLNLGINKEKIRLSLIYPTNWTQRTKIGSTFIDWTNIVKGIPQGSILGRLLFSYFSMICSFSQKNVKPVTLLITLAFIFVVFI